MKNLDIHFPLDNFERLIIDIGFGFGKTPLGNLKLITKIDKVAKSINKD